jgi:hypothetical protein
MSQPAKAFYLRPFLSPKHSLNVKILGQVWLQNTVLHLHYSLVGELEKVIIASPTSQPTRKHDLWMTTCFEFFLGVQDSLSYWEFNLSPTGDWNAYRFQAYRQGMQEEQALSKLPLEIQQQPGALMLNLKLDLAPILKLTSSSSSAISPIPPLELAITAVLESQQKEVSYWALNHCGIQADFHLRESFEIKLVAD